MQPPKTKRLNGDARRWLVPAYFYLGCFFAAACASLLLHKDQRGTLAGLSNFMGLLVENVVHHGVYIVCSAGMTAPGDVICFHANRMPLSPLLLAGLIHILGDHYRSVQLAKVALVLLPVGAAFALVWNSLAPDLPRHIRRFIPLLLLISLLLPIQLVDVINMQVEEGFSFCFLTFSLSFCSSGCPGTLGKSLCPGR